MSIIATNDSPFLTGFSAATFPDARVTIVNAMYSKVEFNVTTTTTARVLQLAYALQKDRVKSAQE